MKMKVPDSLCHLMDGVEWQRDVGRLTMAAFFFICTSSFSSFVPDFPGHFAPLLWFPNPL